MATMEGMPRFFREFTRRASANGWLHLWVLRLDGRAVATEYQIGENGSVHALRADFDASLAELSPGAGLNLRIMRLLFEGGRVREYDMGPGTNPYKLRWATGLHEAVSLEAYAPTASGRLAHGLVTRVLPRLRGLRDRWRAACA
jgi:CelD/BcsL family acetyltransferase involved in cellulose biosynthesis